MPTSLPRCLCRLRVPAELCVLRAGRPGYDKRQMLVYALVAGSRDAADRLLRDVPVLFSTIEDFMWSGPRTACVPTAPAAGRPASLPHLADSCGSGLDDLGQLSVLQFHEQAS